MEDLFDVKWYLKAVVKTYSSVQFTKPVHSQSHYGLGYVILLRQTYLSSQRCECNTKLLYFYMMNWRIQLSKWLCFLFSDDVCRLGENFGMLAKLVSEMNELDLHFLFYFRTSFYKPCISKVNMNVMSALFEYFTKQCQKTSQYGKVENVMMP
jgi:hypothetical protein